LDNQPIPSRPKENPILASSSKEKEGEGERWGHNHEGFKPNPSHNDGKLSHQDQLAIHDLPNLS
jgi:hypothetical protein